MLKLVFTTDGVVIGGAEAPRNQNRKNQNVSIFIRLPLCLRRLWSSENQIVESEAEAEG